MIYILLLAFTLTGCSHSKDASENQKPAGAVIATVNGEKITSADLKKEIAFRKRVDPSFEATPETLSDQIDVMVYRRVLIQEAMRRGLAERETFVGTLRNFWEQTLIKELMDEMSREIGKEVPAADRSAAFQKKLDEIKNRAKIHLSEPQNASKL